MMPSFRIARGPVATLRVALLLCLGLAGAGARAQEMEPRAFSPSPVGANFLVLGYGYQWGSILFDPTLPVTDTTAQVHTLTAGYGRTFDLLGRSASFAVAVPYAWGKAEGNLADQAQEISRSGPCDMRLRLAANLLGGPALSPREFATRTPATTLGASLLVIAPTGQYDPARMINLGMHRWAAKPELGLSHPAGPWTLELTGGVWFFAPNLDYYQGQRRAQDPLLSVQGHACYTFRPRLWLALSSTYYAGGRVFLDGEPSDTRQANSRAGLTLALPMGPQHSLKLTWSAGASTRVGQDFNSVGVAYQYLWF